MEITSDKTKIKKLSRRAIKNIAYGFLQPSLPSYLILYVNNICQLRCDMCFYWDSMQKKTVQMSLDEITKISKSLPNLFQLTLTGGEPSLNKNLPEIVKIFSKYSNLSKCTIVTNGMLYKRIGDFVEKMTIENPEIDFRLSLSVDAIGDLHDKIRGVKGSYDNVIKTLIEQKFQKCNFRKNESDIGSGSHDIFGGGVDPSPLAAHPGVSI